MWVETHTDETCKQEDEMIKYKLTNQDNTTRDYTMWGENVTHEARGEGELCTKGWIHYYDHPLIAVLLNPVHANFRNPKLWECRVFGNTLDDRGLKSGAQFLTTIREIDLPVLTLRQRVKFAILCARCTYHEPMWTRWSEEWLEEKSNSSEYFLNDQSPGVKAARFAVCAQAYEAYDAFAAARNAAFSEEASVGVKFCWDQDAISVKDYCGENKSHSAECYAESSAASVAYAASYAASRPDATVRLDLVSLAEKSILEGV